MTIVKLLELSKQPVNSSASGCLIFGTLQSLVCIANSEIKPDRIYRFMPTDEKIVAIRAGAGLMPAL
jgi:hypothetical protein